MQAKILREQLIKFKSQASGIKTNTLMPILSYIKIEVKGDSCTITKNNLEAFIVQTFESDSGEDCAFLIVENILFNFINFSISKEINFELIRNKIKISDISSFMESPTEPAQTFPMVDLSTTTWIPVSKDLLQGVGVAAKLIFSGEISGPASSVFIGNGHVAGTDGAAGFYQEIKDTIPNIVLRREVAEIITSLQNCEYSCNKGYEYFWSNKEFIYGFSRTETEFRYLPQFFGKVEVTDVASFKLEKSLIMKFCTLCINSFISKKEIVSASFKGENKKLILAMDNGDIKTEYAINTESDFPLFKFNPDKMKTLMEALPGETVFFYPGDKRYLIIGEAPCTFMAVIMGVA